MNNSCENVVALGYFDGVHIGHRALFNAALNLARSRNLSCMAYTFTTHPLATIIKDPPKLIMPANQRIEAIKACGLDVVADEFTPSLQSASPREFAKMLVSRFNARVLVVGYNYSFGHRGAGTPQLLRELGQELGFEVVIIPPVMFNNAPVSSTVIREKIEKGNVTLAKQLLLTPFTLSGIVSSNRHIGRRLGFPTANIAPDPAVVLPLFGVYATRLHVNGETYDSITNVGNNPTFGAMQTTVETNIFDFDGDLYEKEITVEFVSFIRAQQRFETVDDLIEHIANDILSAKRTLSKK